MENYGKKVFIKSEINFVFTIVEYKDDELWCICSARSTMTYENLTLHEFYEVLLISLPCSELREVTKLAPDVCEVFNP